jgi:hypothetical protein
MPNFKFIETIIYDIEAENSQDALEEYREGYHKGFVETVYGFDEQDNSVYSEVDQ